MATSGCCPVTFLCINKMDFYFEVGASDADVDEDTLEMSDLPVYRCLVRSNNDKFLILNDDEEFQVKNLTIDEQRQSECKFNIQFYKQEIRKRKPVMLYVNKNGKKIVACCSENHEICPEEMELPQEIEGNAHKAVFYQTEVSCSEQKYFLESSLYPSEFLGFEPAGVDSTVSKLILRQKHDEVDERCEVMLSRCDQ